METASYAYNVQKSDITVISFNSLYFSNRNNPDNDPGVAEKLFSWMESALQNAAFEKRRVVLLYHLPHGTFVSPFGNETFWLCRNEHEQNVRTRSMKIGITMR